MRYYGAYFQQGVASPPSALVSLFHKPTLSPPTPSLRKISSLFAFSSYLFPPSKRSSSVCFSPRQFAPVFTFHHEERSASSPTPPLQLLSRDIRRGTDDPQTNYRLGNDSVIFTFTFYCFRGLLVLYFRNCNIRYARQQIHRFCYGSSTSLHWWFNDATEPRV